MDLKYTPHVLFSETKEVAMILRKTLKRQFTFSIGKMHYFFLLFFSLKITTNVFYKGKTIVNCPVKRDGFQCMSMLLLHYQKKCITLHSAGLFIRSSGGGPSYQYCYLNFRLGSSYIKCQIMFKDNFVIYDEFFS